jgi:HEAT repeats
MVRSYWKRTLVSSLAWAGLAFGQQPAGPPAPTPAAAPANPTERTLTVQEMGKPPTKCRVVKTWKTPDGATAHQVQALSTGEMLTVVENGAPTPLPGQPAGGRLQAVSTRIYHWGASLTPPPGCPVPPATPAVAQAKTPAPAPKAAAPAPVVVPVVAQAETPAPVPVAPPPPAAPKQMVKQGETAKETPAVAAPAPKTVAVPPAPIKVQPEVTVKRPEPVKVPPAASVKVPPMASPVPAPAMASSNKQRVWPPAHGRPRVEIEDALPSTPSVEEPAAPKVVEKPPTPAPLPPAVVKSSPAPVPVIPVPPAASQPAKPPEPAITKTPPVATPSAPVLPSLTPAPTSVSTAPAKQSEPVVTKTPTAPAPSAPVLPSLAPAPTSASKAPPKPPEPTVTKAQAIVAPSTPVVPALAPAPTTVSNMPPVTPSPAAPPAPVKEAQRPGSGWSLPWVAKPKPTVVQASAAAESPATPSKTTDAAAAPTPAAPAPSKPAWPVVEKASAAVTQAREAVASPRPKSITPVTPAPEVKLPPSHAEARKQAEAQATTTAPEVTKVPATVPEIKKPTPPPPEVKKVAVTAEVKKPAVTLPEVKKPTPPPPEIKKVALTAPEVKKTAPPPPTAGVVQASTAGIAVPGMEATPLTPTTPDWRQSWGKGDERVRTVGRMDEVKTPPKVEKPKVENANVDPLQAPSAYNRPALTQVTPTQRTRSVRQEPVVETPRPPVVEAPRQPTTGAPSQTAEIVSEKQSGPPVVVKTIGEPKRQMLFIHHLRGTPIPLTEEEIKARDAQRQPAQPQPVGMQSVAAAGGAPAALPVAVVSIPPVRHPQPSDAPAKPAAPRVPEHMANAFSPPVVTPAAPVTPPAAPRQPEHMANAFAPPVVVPAERPTAPAAPAMAKAQPRAPLPAEVAQASYQAVSDRPPPGALGLSTNRTSELLTTLKDSLLPSQREWAAEGLAKADGKANPGVVAALIAAAQTDPAVRVRTCCIRSLAQMRVGTPEVKTALEALKADADVRVREEAEQALAGLSAPTVRRAN